MWDERHYPRKLVVLRDLDSGKEIQDIKTSTENAVNKALSKGKKGEKIKLLQHSEFLNIFSAKMRKPDFSIVLHIAQRRCIEGIHTFNT